MGKLNLSAERTSCILNSLITSPFQQATASSKIESVLFGITRSSSIPITLPNPSQVGQAPSGLLKLNVCTVGVSNCIPSASKLFEKYKLCAASPVSDNVYILSRHTPFPS